MTVTSIINSRRMPGFSQVDYILLFCIFLLILLTLQYQPIGDVDIFWQIRTGQLMLETHAPIDHDVFSFTHAGDEVPVLGWSAQILFALAYESGGWRGVLILYSVLYATAYLVAGLTAIRYSALGTRLSPLSLIIGLLVGFLAGSSNVMVRPQSIGILCFATLLYLVRCQGHAPLRLIAIGLIAVVWQNSHPSLAIGLVAIGSLATADWLKKLLHGEQEAPWFLTSATMVLALAQLATPLGWQIFEVSARNLQVSRYWLHIDEWMPPWDASVRSAMIGFFIACGFTLTCLVKQKFRLPLSEWSILITLTALTLFSARFALFWSIAMIPLWTRWFQVLWAHRSTLPTVTTLNPLIIRLAGLLGLGAVLIIPALVQRHPTFLYPLERCLQTLRTAVPAGRIYNFREWGGPLILAGHPAWKVLIDGRLYIYPHQDWIDYKNVALGRMPLKEVMTRYQPDAFFLYPGSHGGLIDLIEKSADFKKLYSDSHCVIYQRPIQN